MRNLINTIEEFNLGRDLRFKGSKKNMTLYLVHGLEASILQNTIETLKLITDFKDIKTCHHKDRESLLGLDPQTIYIYIVHLPLDEEINLHKEISQWAFDNGIYQVNPYNKIAKIFDDKFLFYALMTASEIKQPFTLTLHRNNRVITDDEMKKLARFDKLAIKPRHGTEKIDFAAIPIGDFGLEHSAVTKILKYDDALIQEYIHDVKETKALYVFGDLFIIENWGLEQKKIVQEIVDVVDNFAWANQLIMPEIFSIDLMLSAKEIIVLEANIRPAAIYKYSSF